MLNCIKFFNNFLCFRKTYLWHHVLTTKVEKTVILIIFYSLNNKLENRKIDACKDV